MRVLLRVLVAVTMCLTVSLPAAAGPVHDAAADAAFVQTMLYATPLSEFLRAVDTGDRWFDWTTDWCSAPLIGDTGRSFDFRGPCRRHDFGYRNLRLLEQRYGSGATYWNSEARRRVDQQFLADMKAHCRIRAPWLQASCYGWAQTYYHAVRIAGGP